MDARNAVLLMNRATSTNIEMMEAGIPDRTLAYNPEKTEPEVSAKGLCILKYKISFAYASGSDVHRPSPILILHHNLRPWHAG